MICRRWVSVGVEPFERAKHQAEVAQGGVSDAESVGGDELRELRRPNSSSDPTSQVLTGHSTFRSWCVYCLCPRA